MPFPGGRRGLRKRLEVLFVEGFCEQGRKHNKLARFPYDGDEVRLTGFCLIYLDMLCSDQIVRHR